MLEVGVPAHPARDLVAVRIWKPDVHQIQLGETTTDAAVKAGDMKVEGNEAAFNEFIGLLDVFPFWFNIVTP